MRREPFQLLLDDKGFADGMRRAVASIHRFYPLLKRITHELHHHRPETPARSAMHAAYDRRRRARRRRR